MMVVKKIPTQSRCLGIPHSILQLLGFPSLKGVTEDNIGPLSLQAWSDPAGNGPVFLGTNASPAQDGVGVQVFLRACFIGRRVHHPKVWGVLSKSGLTAV